MSHAAAPLMTDSLAQLRKLPPEIQQQLHILIVDRLGVSDTAYMRTENIISCALPDQLYRLTWDGFEEVEDLPDHQPKTVTHPVQPPHHLLTGNWQSDVDLHNDDANILGGMGSYYLPDDSDTMDIPIAETTAEHLAFYDSQLVKVGETVRFKADAPLPVTIVGVGKTYVKDYLMRAECGSGAYLEYHDRPHFHMPLEPNAAGHLLLGKKFDDGRMMVSAFQIPYGYAISMAPWAIHSDAGLTGRYLVIFSATPNFSNVIIRKKDKSLAKIKCL